MFYATPRVPIYYYTHRWSRDIEDDIPTRHSMMWRSAVNVAAFTSVLRHDDALDLSSTNTSAETLGVHLFIVSILWLSRRAYIFIYNPRTPRTFQS